ncbi:glycosyltransferase family 4 protein [Intrasporangium chromatireducens]|nr:glycosyltransferase family 4 protein [Intrasporangium chromatireducens]
MPEARAAAQLAVCTPWYPTAYNRVGGNFVADWTALGARLMERVLVVHAEEWPGGTEANVQKWAADTDKVFNMVAQRRGFDVAGQWGWITRVPTVITSGWDVPQRALAAVEATVKYAPHLADSPVVHGHVGYLGGLMGARAKNADARLIVTEHSTGLGDLLATPRGRELYDEVLTAAHRLTCVSASVRDQVVEVFPHHAQTVVVVPNPVDFEGAPRRSGPPESLDRWVFGGGLIERKGVMRLVEAFCRFAGSRPASTLDLYGSGPLEADARERLTQAGVASRVTFHGNVAHSEFLRALPHYDVLVAPSTKETFHLVVPEAVAAGLPVVATRSGGPEEALAGVADRVSRFIEVNEDPDELVQAVLELESDLPDLDLESGRAELDSRYGLGAITQMLSSLYGSAETASSNDGGEVRSGTAPAASDLPRDAPTGSSLSAGRGEVVLLSASGWRGYAIRAEGEAAQAAGVPVSVVTGDGGVPHLVPMAAVVEPAAFMASLEGEQKRQAVRDPVTRSSSTTSAVRGRSGRRFNVLPRLRSARNKSRVQSETGPAAPMTAPILDAGSSAAEPSVHILTHISGSAWAAALLQSRPGSKVVTELDRPSLGLPPVDAP